MKKKISVSTQGQRADIGEYVINRMMPNQFADELVLLYFLVMFNLQSIRLMNLLRKQMEKAHILTGATGEKSKLIFRYSFH